jgi:predicted metal-binding protein
MHFATERLQMKQDLEALGKGDEAVQPIEIFDGTDEIPYLDVEPEVNKLLEQMEKQQDVIMIFNPQCEMDFALAEALSKRTNFAVLFCALVSIVHFFAGDGCPWMENRLENQVPILHKNPLPIIPHIASCISTNCSHQEERAKELEKRFGNDICYSITSFEEQQIYYAFKGNLLI